MNVPSYLLILTQLLVAPFSGVCTDVAPTPCEAVHQDVRDIESTCCATADDCEFRTAEDDRFAAAPAKPVFDSDLLGLAPAGFALLAPVSSRSAGGGALLDALPAGLLSLQAQSVRLQI